MKRLLAFKSVSFAYFIIICLLVISGKLPAVAQSTEQNSPQETTETATKSADPTLIVGVSNLPPYAIKSGNDWDGIRVHLWREVAHELDLDYEWRELQPEEVIDRVEDGTVDLAISATATAPAEKQVDFSESYLETSLGVAKGSQRNLWEIVKAVVSIQFLKICLGLAVIYVVIGLLVWLFERHQNSEMFDKHPARGIWAGFWWAGVTMTTIGYGDKAPKTVGGRIVALFWMLVAMGITASLTASITSVLALNQGGDPLRFQDLKNLEVGSVVGSPSTQYLQQEQIGFQSFSTPLEGLQALDKGKIDVFVYNAASLQYLNQQSFGGTMRVEITKTDPRRYAFALPENDQLQESINSQVLQELNESDWQDLINRFLPESK